MDTSFGPQQRNPSFLQVGSALLGRDCERRVQHMSGGASASSPSDGNPPSGCASRGSAAASEGKGKHESQHPAVATHVSYVLDVAQARRFTDTESLRKRAPSFAPSLRPQNTQQIGSLHRTPFKPYDIVRELARTSTTPQWTLAVPYRPPREQSHEAVQDARRSGCTPNIPPVAIEATQSQGGKLIKRGRTRCSRSLLQSPLNYGSRAHQNSGTGYSSRSLLFEDGTPLQRASLGGTRLCLRPAGVSPSTNFFRTISAWPAFGRRPSEGPCRLSACNSRSDSVSARTHQIVSPRGDGRTSSQPPPSSSTGEVWQVVLSNASPELVYFARDLLGEHISLSKSWSPEREARNSRRPSPDAAGTTDDSAEQGVKHDCEDVSTARINRLSQEANQAASEKAYTLDHLVLPDAARRFLLANLLFLKDNQESFSLWAEVHRACQGLIRLSSAIRCTNTPRAKGQSLSAEQSVYSSLARKLEKAQRASEYDFTLTQKSCEQADLEDVAQLKYSQGSTAACLLSAPNKADTAAGAQPLEYPIIQDTSTRDVTPPAIEWERGLATTTSSQPSEDNEDISAAESSRAARFRQEILHTSDDEGGGSGVTGRGSGEAIELAHARLAPSDAGESSWRSSQTRDTSGSTRPSTGDSTGKRVEDSGKTSCSLDCAVVVQQSIQETTEQFDTVVVRLRTAAARMRAPIHAGRSEFINSRAITEGRLLSAIFRLFDPGAVCTPFASALPLVAGSYVLILATLLDARKRCCQLLVTCCNSLHEVFRHQLYKTERLQRELPRWGQASADLTRRMEALNFSTLQLTSTLVAEAKQSFINIMAIAYPFASLLHAHRIRKEQIRKHAHQRRLSKRRTQVGALIVKCHNELAEVQLREDHYGQRLRAALKVQQDTAARAQDLSVSVLNLRKEELELHNRGRATSSRDPGRLICLQAKLGQVGKQRQQQEMEMATLKRKCQRARDLVAGIWVELQRVTATKCQLQEKQRALQTERKSLQQWFVHSNDCLGRHNADLLLYTDTAATFPAAAESCKEVFPNAKHDAEGQLRCIAQLTQLVIRALKNFENGAAACHTGGSASDADVTLLSHAYRRYLHRAGKETDFRHMLLGCTPAGSINDGIDSLVTSESEASFYDDDCSLSLRSLGGSPFECLEPGTHAENSCAQEARRTESTGSRPGELGRPGGGSLVGSVCVGQHAEGRASFLTPGSRSLECAAACSVSKHLTVNCEGPKVDPKATYQLLEEPMLAAHLTAMQVLGAATAAPLSRISGSAWELLNDMLVAYTETERAA